jgi:hypothetical protein
VKILLANPEPSTHGPSRDFAAAQQLGRFWKKADVKWQAGSARLVESDPKRSIAFRSSNLPTPQ